MQASSKKRSNAFSCCSTKHGTCEPTRVLAPPYTRLPAEVVSEIFEHCATGPVPLPPVCGAFPWVLTRICSTWRVIALSTPSLWKNISIDCENVADPARVINAAYTCLARSGAHPLTVQKRGFIREDLSTPSINPVTDLVIPYASRLKELHLACVTGSMRSLLTLPVETMQSLEVLSLKVIDGRPWTRKRRWDRASKLWTARATSFDHSHFPESPSSLREFTLESDFHRLDLSTLNLPWSQLTGLHCITTFVTPLVCHSILRECTSLTSCSLGIAPSDSDFVNALASLPDTLLPNLTSLELRVDMIMDYGLFLTPLILPGLKNLDFDTMYWNRWSQAAFTTLLERSCFSLERLAIGMFIQEQDIVNLLESVPSLSEVVLRYGGAIANTTLERMASGELVPKLEGITCLPASVDALLDMVEKRWFQGETARMPEDPAALRVARLKKVGITSDTDFALHMTRVDRLRAEGIDIHFK